MQPYPKYLFSGTNELLSNSRDDLPHRDLIKPFLKLHDLPGKYGLQIYSALEVKKFSRVNLPELPKALTL